MFKSKSLFTLFLFAATAFTQNVVIRLPTANQTVSPGDELIVQVERPNSLLGSEEVAVVIGLQSCQFHCQPPSEFMGSILYKGPFDPQYHEHGLRAPYQNFTVQVPGFMSTGTALIGVMHVALVGAGLYPYLETLNRTITIA